MYARCLIYLHFIYYLPALINAPWKILMQRQRGYLKKDIFYPFETVFDESKQYYTCELSLTILRLPWWIFHEVLVMISYAAHHKQYQQVWNSVIVTRQRKYLILHPLKYEHHFNAALKIFEIHAYFMSEFSMFYTIFCLHTSMQHTKHNPTFTREGTLFGKMGDSFRQKNILLSAIFIIWKKNLSLDAGVSFSWFFHDLAKLVKITPFWVWKCFTTKA